MRFFKSSHLTLDRGGHIPQISGMAGGLLATLFCLVCAATAAVPAGEPVQTRPDARPRLTQARFESLLRATAKRIATLRLQAVIRRQFYITRAMARQTTNGVRRMFPPQLQAYTAPAGLIIRSQLVRFEWDVPAGLVTARKIQVGGEVDVGPGGKLLTGLAHASIWVVGRRLFWHAFPGGGVWNVTVGRRSSAWFTRIWPGEFRILGFSDISMYWVPFATPMVPANGLTKLPLGYRLASQKIDRSTGLIRLRYLELYKGRVHRVPGVGTCEYLYVLRLAGGLRIYHKVYEAVGGPKGTIRFFEADFKKFVRSGGVWFPRRIHERSWPHGGGRAFPDETITIKHVVVNGTFPPHTFRYEPPFGAMVTDARTKPASIYFIGSKNPKVPPTTTPAAGTNGSASK